MSDEKLLNPEYIAEMENALDEVTLQMTLDLLKEMIERDHFLLMNWQLFKYQIEETANSTTLTFMGPFGELGEITVVQESNQYNCYVYNGKEKFSSEYCQSIDEVISFIFNCVDSTGKKLAA